MIVLCWIPSLRKGQLNNLKDHKELKSNFIIQLKNHKIFQESCPIRSQQSKKNPQIKQDHLHINILFRQKENKKSNSLSLNLWEKAKYGTKISNKINKNKIEKLSKSLNFYAKNYLTSAPFKVMSGIEFYTYACNRIVLRESDVLTVFCIAMRTTWKAKFQHALRTCRNWVSKWMRVSNFLAKRPITFTLNFMKSWTMRFKTFGTNFKQTYLLSKCKQSFIAGKPKLNSSPITKKSTYPTWKNTLQKFQSSESILMSAKNQYLL